jgi:predicted peptidase
MTRREAVRLLGSVSVGACLSIGAGAEEDSTPPLAAGTPMSPERIALIDAFKGKSSSIVKSFEARTHKSDWVMPYRLFRPAASGKLPLVLYLHGSGGLGDDNQKQMGLGNVFGTRVWALPENQNSYPCYVVVPQTDRGWNRYAPPSARDTGAKAIPGLGAGARLALEIVDALCREFTIDKRRIYVTGQSMGGAGTWNVITYRPDFFAAAVICCGSISPEDGSGSIDTPVWNFHGDSDKTVPVSTSRARMAARRKAGGHPLYTEYAGVDHNVWEWAYTEPELVKWIFAQRRSSP